MVNSAGLLFHLGASENQNQIPALIVLAKTDYYTVCRKNESFLASCSIVKHGLILIISGKQHKHAFKNYTHI